MCACVHAYVLAVYVLQEPHVIRGKLLIHHAQVADNFWDGGLKTLGIFPSTVGLEGPGNLGVGFILPRAGDVFPVLAQCLWDTISSFHQPEFGLYLPVSLCLRHLWGLGTKWGWHYRKRIV